MSTNISPPEVSEYSDSDLSKLRAIRLETTSLDNVADGLSVLPADQPEPARVNWSIYEDLLKTKDIDAGMDKKYWNLLEKYQKLQRQHTLLQTHYDQLVRLLQKQIGALESLVDAQECEKDDNGDHDRDDYNNYYNHDDREFRGVSLEKKIVYGAGRRTRKSHDGWLDEDDY
jgi:hypothetical protein